MISLIHCFGSHTDWSCQAYNWLWLTEWHLLNLVNWNHFDWESLFYVEAVPLQVRKFSNFHFRHFDLVSYPDFFRHINTYIYCAWVKLKGPRPGTLSENILGPRVSRLAQNALPRLVQGLFTKLISKNWGSVLRHPYPFNGSKICLGTLYW